MLERERDKCTIESTVSKLISLLNKLTEVFQDACPNFRHVHPGKPPHYRSAVWPHQKLLKVPLDVVDLERFPEQSVGVTETVPHRWASILQKCEKGLFVVSIHIHLLK